MRQDRLAFERSLAARLIAGGKLDEPAAERALRLRASSEERLEQILTKLGLVHERDVAEAISSELGLPLVNPADYPDAPVLESASPKFLKQAQILPLSDTPDRLVLAVTDPLDEYSVRSLALLTGKPVEIRIATPSDVELAYEKLYGGQKSTISQIVNEIEAEESGSDEDVDRLRDLASEEPVIRLVNLLISRAVESRASDIHIEPFLNRLGVRFRVDGVLREGATPPVRLRSAIVSRIKIMAKLNIAERRLPQDGRIRIAIRGRDYDLRVATVPTLHGEGVTLRILDRASLVEDFAVLGFAPDTLARYLELLERPQGILLVTGPTGSGKTTTLYTSLMRLNTPEKKIFTVEDPIEYQLEGVNQVQVKPQIKLTFVEILRALLRHNPDVIMIGEMRDFETAQIAIQAALTGHLVLSTLHTNNAASSITRLLDMKIEDYLVTSTVNGVMAQRLVRRLCEACRRPRRVLPEFYERMGMTPLMQERTATLYEPVGCEHCHQSGYRGQTAVIEVLPMSDTIRQMVLRHAEAREIHRAAVEEGMRPMYQDGLIKALDGVTTIEEVLRVTRDV
ncbi:MAG TPA: type II secretion system ATPase GspE [Stellaceae bacterium]|nr:type II secretion system ATPase GspE [Stellaceae bacterium]